MSETAVITPPAASPWAGLVGQSDAIAILRQAASDPGDQSAGASSGMTHAWLLTGPPGSGRSNLAYAFAAALLSRAGVEGDPATTAQVAARTHPDLLALSTEKVTISIKEARDIVERAAFAPAVGRYRVVVIEDADRMAERTANVLLKSLEEPPECTVWVLCAPSEADLLPTIRSRVRTVRLRVPAPADVASLLVERDGVDPAVAALAARHAQSHIGMARRLALSPDARDRRDETIDLVLGVRTVSAGMMAAAHLIDIATSDGKALSQQRDEAERHEFLRSLGVEEGGTVPAQLRSQLRQLEEDQKRRAVRATRDGLDRILVDLLACYRDVLTVQLGSGAELVNPDRETQLASHARLTTAAESLGVIAAIDEARTRIGRNVAPLLALEALMMTALPSRHEEVS